MYYLRLRMNRWTDLEADLGFNNRQPMKSPGKSIGFLEVYETLEDMKQEYPLRNGRKYQEDVDYVRIEETKS